MLGLKCGVVVGCSWLYFGSTTPGVLEKQKQNQEKIVKIQKSKNLERATQVWATLMVILSLPNTTVI